MILTCTNCKSTNATVVTLSNTIWQCSVCYFENKLPPNWMKINHISIEETPLAMPIPAGMERFSNIEINDGVQLQVVSTSRSDGMETLADLQYIQQMSTCVYKVTKTTEPKLLHVFNALPPTTYIRTPDEEFLKDSLIVFGEICVEIKKPIFNKGQDGIRLFIFKHADNVYCVHERNIYMLRDLNGRWTTFADKFTKTQISMLLVRIGDAFIEDSFIHIIVSPPLTIRGPYVPESTIHIISTNMDIPLSPRISHAQAIAHLEAAWYNTVHIRDEETGQQYIVCNEEMENASKLMVSVYTGPRIREMYLAGSPLSHRDSVNHLSHKIYLNSIISNRRDETTKRRYVLRDIQLIIPFPVGYICDKITHSNGTLCFPEAELHQLRTAKPEVRILANRDVKQIVVIQKDYEFAINIISDYAWGMLSAIAIAYHPAKETSREAHNKSVAYLLWHEAKTVITDAMSLCKAVMIDKRDLNFDRFPAIEKVRIASESGNGLKRSTFLTYLINQPYTSEARLQATKWLQMTQS